MEGKEEINIFSHAIKLALDEFYLDAIEELKSLIENYPQSELVDDAYFNIGLCYFHLNQIPRAIDSFNVVIDEYPDSTISVLNETNEYGKTPAKCWLCKIHCYLKTDNLDDARKCLRQLEHFPDSYIVVESVTQMTFFSIGSKLINNYIEVTKP